jgi:hypothetical protein
VNSLKLHPLKHMNTRLPAEPPKSERLERFAQIEQFEPRG